MSVKITKKLWGKAGGLCSICKQPLIIEKNIIGEESHIFGQKNGSARFDNLKPNSEVDSYENLILLCPNHHEEIDKNPIDWTTEKLIKIKDDHERWVSQNISFSKLSEIEARISLSNTSGKNIIGIDINQPTRLKAGTQVKIENVSGENITGIKVGGNGGDSR